MPDGPPFNAFVARFSLSRGSLIHKWGVFCVLKTSTTLGLTRLSPPPLFPKYFSMPSSVFYMFSNYRVGILFPLENLLWDLVPNFWTKKGWDKITWNWPVTLSSSLPVSLLPSFYSCSSTPLLWGKLQCQTLSRGTVWRIDGRMTDSPSRWCWWWWWWWGPFLVYFLPILGGQKAAVSDSVEGWLPGRGMVCSRQPWSFQSVHPHGRPDRWTEGRMTGRAGSGAASFVISTSFNNNNNNNNNELCSRASISLPTLVKCWQWHRLWYW